MRILAFEGLPGAGKTTTARTIVQQVEAAVLLPEYHDLADPSYMEWLRQPSQTSESQRARLDLYRRLEKRRWLRVEAHHRVVLLDRSWISIAAYTIALAGVTTLKQARPYLVEAKALAVHDPDIVVMFDLKVDEAIARLRPAAVDTPMLQRDFLDMLQVSYELVLQACTAVWRTDASRPASDLAAEMAARIEATT